MKRYIVWCAALVMLLAGPVYAKRDMPKKVDPVVGGGIRYEAPNRLSCVVVIEARDEKTGEKLWERIVYEVKIDPKLEEDVQWDFITRLRLQGNDLFITTESHREYKLDVKTRKVEEITKDKPANN